MEKWIHENLDKILNYPVPDELIQYLMKMENVRDTEEFLRSFLDMENAKHRQFIEELKKRLASKDQIGYKKTNDIDDDNARKKQNAKKKGKGKAKEIKQATEFSKPEKVEKKKSKYDNIYFQEGKDRATVLLKGRHKCDCEAKKHDLINNCLNCGRIVCAQEGAGPCFFCEELVCSMEEQLILSSKGKQSGQLYNKLMNQKPNKNLEESVKQRNKLLEYDRDGVQITKVIDDECDYYQSNSKWLTGKARAELLKLEEEIQERKHMSRLNRNLNVTFDFMGKGIIEEKPADDYNLFDEEYLQPDISESFDGIESNNVCPNTEFIRPMYIESNELETYEQPYISKKNVHSLKSIVQDKEYLEISDSGVCLSMHQPQASLLVAGIKTHEGRTWYSSHRGRLWIAAASKQPSKQDIMDIEQCYRVLKNEKLKFPETYPTSCLLGCVTVTDVLSQEEYRKLYPEGECDSLYVFICENFFALPIKFPVQGKHKIYKLDPKIHHAALKNMEKFTKIN